MRPLRLTRIIAALAVLLPSPWTTAAAGTILPGTATPVASVPAIAPSAALAAATALVPAAASLSLSPVSGPTSVDSGIPPEAPAAEETAQAGARLFDRSGDYEARGFGPAAVEDEAFARFMRAVVVPPAEAGDDGGGAEYPHRTVRFNGLRPLDLPAVALRPNVPVEPLLVAAINNTKSSIRLSLYEFSSRNILSALQKAKARGVKVQIILDFVHVFPKNEPGASYRQRRSDAIWALVRDGFDVRVARGATPEGINHNKLAVFDGRLASFGSYNWSFTSEMNHYENLFFSDDKARVAGVNEYWEYLWSLSVPEAQGRNHSWPTSVRPPPQSAPRLRFHATTVPAWIFTPNGDVLEDEIAAAIDAARTSVDYGMFSPRSTKIASALVAAARRGLTVRAVIDESQSKSEYFKPFVDWLAANGVEVRTLTGPHGEQSDFPLAEKMHGKFMVLDGILAEAGSANHTKRASMDNFENAHFLNDADDVAALLFQFDHMFALARPIAPATAPTLPTDAELRDAILHPPVRPAPPATPAPAPLPAARNVRFRDHDYPASAFRPYEPVIDHILTAIRAAKSNIKISIYQFEQQVVLDALKQAKADGVKVEVVIDRAHVYTTGTSHTGGPRKPRPLVVDLVRAGFDLLLLKGQGSGINHNKFLIVDDELMEYGSYNYTDQSETDHFENARFTTDKKRIALYLRYYAYMRENGEALDEAKLDEILNRVAPEGVQPDSAGDDSPSFDSSEPETAGKPRKPPKPKFPPPPADEDPSIRLHDQLFPLAIFSPRGGIEEALIRAVGACVQTVDIAMFSFWSRGIAEALVDAHRRGVRVRVALDKGQASLSAVHDWLAWHGIEVTLVTGPDDTRDPLYQKMHNKFAVFDGLMLETGSFNYSPNAELNSFENANFDDDTDEVARYAAYFARILSAGFPARKPRREPVWKDSTAPAA